MRPTIKGNVGVAVEYMFNAIAKKAQWSKTELPSKKVLLRIMNEINSSRLNKCLRAIESSGEDLMELTNQDVMDYIYGVDFLIEVESIDGDVTIAIDVTADPSAVDSKAKKLIELKPAIKAGLGADHTLILVWNNDVPFGQMTEAQQYEVIGRISDRIDTLVTKKKWCASITI
jgi:hypothetical protein